MGNRTQNNRYVHKKETSQEYFLERFSSVDDVIIAMVNLRGPSAKQSWDGLERLDRQLEELGVGTP